MTEHLAEICEALLTVAFQSADDWQASKLKVTSYWGPNNERYATFDTSQGIWPQLG